MGAPAPIAQSLKETPIAIPQGWPSRPVPAAPDAPDGPKAPWGVQFWLALASLGSFMGFVLFASLKPPQLPGDTLGLILGAMIGWVTLSLHAVFPHGKNGQ